MSALIFINNWLIFCNICVNKFKINVYQLLIKDLGKYLLVQENILYGKSIYGILMKKKMKIINNFIAYNEIIN